jgi:hypothetical protein
MSIIDEQELDLQLGEARAQLRQELAERKRRASSNRSYTVYSAFNPRTKKKPKKLKSLSGLGEALL